MREEVPTVKEASLDDAGDTNGVIAIPTGANLAFEVRGASHVDTPALLIRPLAGSMALWGEFRDVLAASMRVIAYDPRGVGNSSPAPLDVTTRDMARDAVSVLDALGVSQAHVFGISLGAMVATWLAIDAPGRVARLCLACAGPVGFALTPSGLVRGAEMATAVLAPEDEVVARLAEAVLSDEVREHDPERVEAVEAAAAGDHGRPLEIVKLAAAAARHDARAALLHVTAPTLVLAAERDALIGTEAPEALARSIRDARFEVIAEAGHDLTLEKAQETARRVYAFFHEGR